MVVKQNTCTRECRVTTQINFDHGGKPSNGEWHRPDGDECCFRQIVFESDGLHGRRFKAFGEGNDRSRIPLEKIFRERVDVIDR